MRPSLRLLCLSLCALAIVRGHAAPLDASPTTREMNLLDWQAFAALVPERIETVLVPVGTLEPHGVIPDGADNLAPEGMAKVLAPRLNALVAPTLNYGVTGDLDAFPGAFSIDADAYEAFVTSLLEGARAERVSEHRHHQRARRAPDADPASRRRGGGA